jgi:hypothetical protein
MTAKKKRSRKPVGEDGARANDDAEVTAEPTEASVEAEMTEAAEEPPAEATEELDADEGEAGPSLWQRVRPFAAIATSAYLLIALLWILTGSMTTGPNMCADCHAQSVHKQAGATDPHFGVACVNCHEPGGWVARLTSNVPMRLQHFLEAQSDSVRSQPFGQKVSSAGCAECHKKDMAGTLYDPTRAVSMSHKEPIEVGAECMDCHIFKGGEISAGTSGMANCIRCHDGKTAKAECGVCHQGDPTDAGLPQISPKKLRSRLVPTADCTACHDSSACRKCHGATLPRPSE